MDVLPTPLLPRVPPDYLCAPSGGAQVHLPHKAEMAQQQLLLGHLGFVVLPCVTLLISDLELGFVLVFTG